MGEMGQEVPQMFFPRFAPNPCFGNGGAAELYRYHPPGGGAIPMSATGCPMVIETKGNALNSLLETAATLLSANKLSHETTSIEPGPEQARGLLQKQRLPSNEPATHCLLSLPGRNSATHDLHDINRLVVYILQCQCYGKSPQFQGEV
jgi:hypothetical protein